MENIKCYGNYIDGKWTEPSTGRYYKNINPADREDVIGQFPLSGADDAIRAVESSNAAFQSWKRLLFPERQKYIANFIAALERRSEEIAFALVRELGKTLNESRGEPARAIAESRYNMGEAERMEGITMPSDRHGVISLATRVPLGVVAAISPWNFPFMTPVRKIIPALACGNTVVFKPASDTPHSAVLLMELFDEAGFPPGVVNMVIGKGGEIGDTISSHPYVRGVTFTGSTEVGRRIATLTAEHFAKVQLEMGGKNPGLVGATGRLKTAAVTIADAAMQLAGQRCTSISRAIVLEDQADEFEALVAERLASYKIGNGLEPGVMYGPVINDSAGEKILNYIQIAKDEGATVKYGGNRITGGDYDKGFYIEPTLLSGVTPKMTVAVDEIFGPVLSVIRVKDFAQAIAVANDTKYGLSSCLFTDDDEFKWMYAQNVDCGMSHINHGTVTDGSMPFGGLKSSGMGAPSKGSTGKDFFTQWKMLYTKYI